VLASAVVAMDISADSLFQISTWSSEDEMVLHCIRNYLCLVRLSYVCISSLVSFLNHRVHVCVFHIGGNITYYIWGVKNRHFCTMWTTAIKYQNNFSLFPFSRATHFSLLCCCKVKCCSVVVQHFLCVGSVWTHITCLHVL